MDHVIIALIVITIILAIYIHVASRRLCIARDQHFMAGFWRATAASCETKGYGAAYLYIDDNASKHSRLLHDVYSSRAYIIALARGQSAINCPFEFVAEHSLLRDGTVSGRMVIDNDALRNSENARIMVTLDYARTQMTWYAENGDLLFSWEKNAQLSSHLAQDA